MRLNKEASLEEGANIVIQQRNLSVDPQINRSFQRKDSCLGKITRFSFVDIFPCLSDL